MNELEELALNHIRSLTQKGQDMLSTTAVKSHNKETVIDAQKDIYPAHSVFGSIDRWAEAILKNQSKNK